MRVRNAKIHAYFDYLQKSTLALIHTLGAEELTAEQIARENVSIETKIT